MKKPEPNIVQYHLHKEHPEKLQFQVYDLASYRKQSGTKAAIPHFHSYYQIIWFRDTTGTHWVDFNSYEITQNTMLFIAKDQVHYFDQNLEVEGWLIHFNESFFTHSDIAIFLKYNIFDPQQNPCCTLNMATASIASSYINLIQHELLHTHAFGYQDVIRYLLKSFLIHLERAHQKNIDKRLEPTNAYALQFFRFKELVEQNYSTNITVKTYASLLHISPKTLATITKSIVQKTPSQIITERIVLEAKRLLRFTALQISEVSFKLGFEDDSYFVKYFKRNIGQSPKNYRTSVS